MSTTNLPALPSNRVQAHVILSMHELGIISYIVAKWNDFEVVSRSIEEIENLGPLEIAGICYASGVPYKLEPSGNITFDECYLYRREGRWVALTKP